ncbi:MAG: protein kinase [Oscillospiraceae bacterium]
MLTEKGHLCSKCMKEIEDFDICPFCGFSQSSPYLPECLAPKTSLQERYSVGAMIKKTGEAISYMGYDHVTDSPVIIKEFFPSNIAGRDNQSNKIYPFTGSESKYKSLLLDFVDLAKIMTRSRSLSAVIPVLDVFEENNTVYTISQYIEAITLREYLMQIGGEIDWEQAKAKFAPIISAINTIHSSVNLNHLGISPETILVDKSENFKISDFSIEALRITKSEIIPEIYAGYAAPEQYNSANWLGEWSDVYAIAAVIYKTVTGTMPPESTGRIVNDNLVAAYKLNKNVPVNISNALMKAMNVSPELRTQTVD